MQASKHLWQARQTGCMTAQHHLVHLCLMASLCPTVASAMSSNSRRDHPKNNVLNKWWIDDMMEDSKMNTNLWAQLSDTEI